MAFCTECGKEITSGTKFCEFCGAPVEQAPQTSGSPTPVQPPQQPLVATPPPKKTRPVMYIAAGIVILMVIVAAAYFVGLPYLQKSKSGTTTTPTPTIKPPGRTITPTITATKVLTPTPTIPVRKLEGRLEESYDEIYTLNQFFAFGQKQNFDYDLNQPPLYIKFNLTPKLITREKMINIGLSTEQTINISYPNPNAWFEIRVLDANSGAVVDDQGFGKDFPDVTQSEFMVRNPGKYRIEFSGNDVTAEISVLKGIT